MIVAYLENAKWRTEVVPELADALGVDVAAPHLTRSRLGREMAQHLARAAPEVQDAPTVTGSDAGSSCKIISLFLAPVFVAVVARKSTAEEDRPDHRLTATYLVSRYSSIPS